MTEASNADETSCESENLSSNPQVGPGFLTGAVVPQDLTVKFVRADSALWEVLLSVASSLFLTCFGLLLGAWISSKSANESIAALQASAIQSGAIAPSVLPEQFGVYAKASCILFGLLSLAALGIWGVLKVKQSRKGVVVPIDTLCSTNQG